MMPPPVEPELRSSKSEVRKKPEVEARMRWFQSVALEHFFHRVAEAGFGPRLSAFFRTSGLRISEFGLKHEPPYVGCYESYDESLFSWLVRARVVSLNVILQVGE